MKRIKAIQHVERPVTIRDGKWIYEAEDREVNVMATADGYAMVRRPGCAPYVCMEKELTYL